MSKDELSTAMDSWRRLVDSRVASPNEEKTHAQQLAMLDEALAVARPFLVPSGEGLFGQLAEIMQAWKAEWTNELRSSSVWESAQSKLLEIREMIDLGDLAKAENALGRLLIRGSAGVRTLDLEVSVRHLEREDDDPMPPSKPEALLEVIDWLNSV